jgi:hypothetical protein
MSRKKIKIKENTLEKLKRLQEVEELKKALYRCLNCNAQWSGRYFENVFYREYKGTTTEPLYNISSSFEVEPGECPVCRSKGNEQVYKDKEKRC